MTQSTTGGPLASPASARLLPWLLLLFVGSGCAALIYEIVWFQMLQLVIGSSAVSLGVLLGTFMGGMCLGSLVLARLVSARHHPLRVYALIELGIAVCGLAVLLVLPSIARVYLAGAAHGWPGILIRGAASVVCLLLPTMLMGATLPAISRWIESTRQGISWLGFFYGGNIAGAVLGCLLAGFYLLRVHDMATATYVAAALNVTIGVIGLLLATQTTYQRPADNPSVSAVASRMPGSGLVYATIALSGLSALGAEVIWTRLLSLMLGPTVYTFSIILAVFLVGLGMGSGIGSLLARGMTRPRMALGGCQVLLMAAITWSAYMLAKSIPFWPINPALSSNPWFTFQLDLVRCAWATWPGTILWGASFPLALAAFGCAGQDPGRWVGRVYAANTFGAIVGAIGCSMILIPWAGTQQAQQVLVGVSGLAAVTALASGFWPGTAPAPSASQAGTVGFQIRGLILVLAVAGAAVLLGWSIPRIPGGVIAYGRFLSTKNDMGKILYVGEGLNASVAVTELSTGVRNFHVSGKVEASTEPQDMRLQRMLGHLPALLHPQPRSVLVVGCGAGVTAGSFVVHPGIERIVICEIEPLIPQVVSRYFGKENYDVVRDPRVTVVYDDARHYILTTREKFDIITSDPIHPWVKGAATLYTREYFDLVKEHLNPGGLVTQWVPLYESTPDVVKSEIATFFAAFPGGTIWGNDQEGDGYDLVLLGQVGALNVNLDELNPRLHRDPRLTQSLGEVGFRSVISLLGTYAGRAADLQPWLEHAEINRDRNLRLQYLAGLGLNGNQGISVYEDMLTYRRFPADLFVGSSSQRVGMLRIAIEGRKTEP